MAKSPYIVVKFLKLDSTSLICTITLSSILILSGFSGIVKDASAQTFDPIGDFLCWDIEEGQTAFGTNLVNLRDQFRTSFDINQFRVLEFCESSDKNIEPFNDVTEGFSFFTSPYMEQHYTTFEILDGFNPPQIVDIRVSNFGVIYENVVIGQIRELWVPNDKIRIDTVSPPFVSEDKEHHYTCYDIDTSLPNLGINIQMDNQFGVFEMEVLDPFLLCTPTQKEHNGMTFNDPQNFPETTDPDKVVEDIREHLVCYNIAPLANTDLMAVTDQLIEDVFTPYLPVDLLNDLHDKVCFESTKTVEGVAGTFVPIDSSMLLLAGTQMIGAWIAPAIVAAAGIAIVLGRKY